ncbi:MAG: methyltransferase domain-containing protein [Erysipelotrichaceae bacterium]|nr:methyltransferase domain-containing protein [Erysipelotrichaceae bacterium]
MNILCPHCKNILKRYDNTYRCINGHSFDIARQGYVNLNLHNSQNTGDNPDMINARKEFLEKDYYAFMKRKVNELLSPEDTLVDLACGEGYYTKDFICKDKIGIDLSKQGLKTASKDDKNTTYLLSSIFHCPLEDESADKIITIFAPIAKEEIRRILKKDGLFILVKPDVNHLYELKSAIYENPYYNETEDIDIPGLTLINEIPVSDKALLEHQDIMNLFAMTPYYHKTSISDKEKLNSVESLEISFAFLIDVYQKL